MIVGKRVRLRSLEREDLPKIVPWLNDDETRQFISLRVPLSLAQEQDWFERQKNKPLEQQVLAIEVFTEQGWQYIGNTGFDEIDQLNRSAEIGIVIGDKDYWSKGYGTDAMRLMLFHGFTNLNLQRIWLRVFETNKRGIRCYEKAGFVHEGRLRQAQFFRGKFVDVLIMGVLRKEWKLEE